MTALKVLKVDQPIGEFYIGAIRSTDLLEISTVDVRRFSEGRADSIDGIQRELSKTRLKSLREYVNLDYATFPTSVILAIDHRCVELKPISGCDGLFSLIVKEWPGDDDEESIPLSEAAFILDGQHRLAGLESRNEGLSDFEVNVSIFVGADIADQAEIFSRVNLAQTKVNKSLAYDLLDYATEKSPFKVAHDVVVALNRDSEGPFFKKIKRLGVKTKGVDSETLAQATVVNGLLRHLPKGQERERSKSILGLGQVPEPRESWENRIFVDFYRSDDFISILEIVSNYFEAVRTRWRQPWEEPREGQILCRTTGYNALIRFLKDAYLAVATEPIVVGTEDFLKIFQQVDIKDSDLTSEFYKPGSSGSGTLYRELLAKGIPVTKERS